VGPIRSGRTQDILLLGSFNQPLAWSGGNGNVTRAIESSDFCQPQCPTQQRTAWLAFRNEHKSPHNLYASTTAAWTLAPEGAGAPPQQFLYLAPGNAGGRARGCRLVMDGLPVEWRFDTGGCYMVPTVAPHNDQLSGQVSTENVIIMFVDYQPSPADARSPEAQTIGAGEAWVFTGGVLVRGTWARADRLSAVVLHDAAGTTIPLTPGRSFVELARVGTANPVA
jgi:hypothetical protein